MNNTNQKIRDYLQFQKELGLESLPFRKNESIISKNDENLGETMGLNSIQKEMGDCKRCELHEGRNKIVFGEGNPNADLMFIGEAPGAEEDKQGIPFVGRAGKLLTKIIEAMGYKRDEVYIANICKCRPPANRNPLPAEVDACIPFLLKQFRVIKPRVVVCLGSVAVRNLLGEELKISRVRGQFLEYEGVTVMPTFHPAYLLRNPHAKKDVWEDMKKVMAVLKED